MLTSLLLCLFAADPPATRFVFFGPVPSVIEYRVTIEGRSIAENRAAAAAMLLGRLDADDSGTLSAAEAAGLEPLPGGEDGAPPPKVETLFPAADADAGGDLTAAELTSLLDAAVGPPVVIDFIEGRTLRDLSLERFLDVDASGRITPEEYADGFARLSRVDFDDDSTLSAAELATFAKAARAEQGVRRLLLAAGAAETTGQLTGPVPDVAERWKQRRWSEIDADSDGRVSGDEAAVWAASAEADLSVALTLVANRGNRIGLEIGESRLRPARVSRQRRRTRAGATLGEATLDFRVTNANFVASDGRDFLILKHRTADVDSDGSLNEQEYGGLDPAPAPFRAVDANGDGLIPRDELTAYLDDVQRLAQLQVRLDVEDVTENLFDAVDTDIDRRLSPREVRAASSGARVASAGRSVRVTALTDVINFLGAEPPAMAAAQPRPIIRERLDGPNWFRRMDRNQDGDLQWREFLGPRPAFDRLDADSDGLISVDEAAGP